MPTFRVARDMAIVATIGAAVGLLAHYLDYYLRGSSLDGDSVPPWASSALLAVIGGLAASLGYAWIRTFASTRQHRPSTPGQTRWMSDNDPPDAILNALPVGIALFDKGGRLIKSNDQWEAHLEARDDSQLESAVRACVADMIADKASVICWTRPYTDGDKVRWFRSIASPIRNSDFASAVVARFDVTHEREIEEREKQLRRDFARANRLYTINELAGEISHELNQPLTSITNFAETLRGLYGRGHVNADTMRQTLELIALEAQRAGYIMRRMRNFTRRTTDETKEIDVNAAIREAASILVDEMEQADISVQLHLNPLLPCLRADDIQIRQVIVNLLQNAVESIITTNKKAREIVVSTRLERAIGSVLIEIRDSGGGIPTELTARIFDPFFTTKPNGVGLGLRLCQKIVEGHEGHIECVPFSPGALFRIRLPVRSFGNARSDD